MNTESNFPEPILPEPILTESKGPELLKLGDLISELEAFSQTRFMAKSSGIPFGPVPPWSKLAAEFNGAMPSGVHVLLGGPGIGKTAFALQLAARCQCPALYVTCEMRPLELLARTIARETGTFLGKLKNGELTGARVRELAEKAAAGCPGLAILDGTTGYASPDAIERAARHVQGDAPHVLVIVDSLNEWTRSAEVDEASEYETMTEGCRTLRQLAGRLGCPILAICERNRASFGKGAAKSKMQAGAGSRSIEYGSESLMSLDLDPDESEGLPEKTVTLTLEKNRHGSAGAKVPLAFHGAKQDYTQL